MLDSRINLDFPLDALKTAFQMRCLTHLWTQRRYLYHLPTESPIKSPLSVCSSVCPSVCPSFNLEFFLRNGSLVVSDILHDGR